MCPPLAKMASQGNRVRANSDGCESSFFQQEEALVAEPTGDDTKNKKRPAPAEILFQDPSFSSCPAKISLENVFTKMRKCMSSPALGLLLAEKSAAEEAALLSSRKGADASSVTVSLTDEEREKDGVEATTSSPSETLALEAFLNSGEWESLVTLLEEHPSLCRQSVRMVCQGETTYCPPLHCLVGRKDLNANLRTVEATVAISPAALLHTDQRLGRLPLHLAIIRSTTDDIIHFLCRSQPLALQVPDWEGNLPLHHAAMYCKGHIVDFIRRQYPAARHVNNKGRLPLHILVSTSCDCTFSPSLVAALLEEYPESASLPDRKGRAPLHLACAKTLLRWDVIELLIKADPSQLLVKEFKTKKTPLELARTFSSGDNEDVVIASLEECTKKEARRQGCLLQSVLSTLRPQRRPSKKMSGWYNCYG